MKIPFLSNMTQLVGIDLGTTTTRIWTDTDGVVLEEATCLAIDSRTERVMAVGNEAAAMAGRVGDVVQIHRPVQGGDLYDLDVARAMLKVFLQKVLKTSAFVRPVMMASIPASSTEAERMAMVELLDSVGAREAYTISQPLAAAIGSGVPIADSSGSFLVQMGSGVVEGAIISLGSMVAFESSRKAGQRADVGIQTLLKNKHSLLVGAEAAEHLKIKVGGLGGAEKQALVTGKDMVKLSPTEVMVTTAMIQAPLLEQAALYQRVLKQLFAKIPPELTVDVIDKGILLAGGFAQLDGLDQYLVQSVGVSVAVVEDPSHVVIKGIGTTLEHLGLFKESLGYQL
ncbi:MAG: rod shape-determining protein [bacterium]|nr:rod shape-determining protein [bacterium]